MSRRRGWKVLKAPPSLPPPLRFLALCYPNGCKTDSAEDGCWAPQSRVARLFPCQALAPAFQSLGRARLLEGFPFKADAAEDGLQRSRVDWRVEVKVNVCESLPGFGVVGGLSSVETARSFSFPFS